MAANSKKPSPVVLGCLVILLPALLYMLFFVAVILDEFVFQTYYISEYSPEWLIEILRFIYGPLVRIFID